MPTSMPEDYIRNGIWQNETMKMDLEILECHRREGGAPAPPPLDEVPVPKLPPGTLKLLLPSQQLQKAPGLTPLNPLQPISLRGALAAAGPFSKSVGVTGAAAPPGVVAKATGLPVAGAVGDASAPAAPLADLREIAMFIAKWRLEPTRAKLVLAQLSLQRRQYVMHHFLDDPAGEGAAIDRLVKYIQDCEQSGAWGGGPSPAGAQAAPTPAAG
eukprot:CAMPEP_0178414898 /NCGR_PEP_ID=MMETSP0689_2-20121128/23273_1 /TAXON_ID=160604 /ORGANISM="Amphidinium massartii, Strain CS-259" /LENGTH=213 /DNA_ID=CAMNT_0020036201 /DNA_START=1 /DNA_END=638 /DNA_ORIENTATION=+